MPEDDFIIWEIEGLCIGGYGAHRSTGVGYFLFMRGTPGAEKKRFQWIRENILFPFINWGRKEYNDFDVDSGAPMGDKLTAVSWCDGDHSQIDTIVSPDGIHRYSANNVIANKHNASGTGKEQACDLGKVFTISKKLNKSTTVEHIPSSNHLLKSKLESQFAKFNTKLRIRGRVNAVAGTSAEAYCTFIEHVLKTYDAINDPAQRRTLIHDKLSLHKASDVYEAVRDRGHRVVCLPPYRPQDGPVEFAINQVCCGIERHWLEASDLPTMQTLVKELIDVGISGMDATFVKCG